MHDAIRKKLAAKALFNATVDESIMVRDISDKLRQKIATANIHEAAEKLPPAIINRFEMKKQMATGELHQQIRFGDMIRITGLPITENMPDDEFEQFCYDHMLAKAFDRGDRFFPVQANSGKAFFDNKGLVGTIGVGWGKTLLTLLLTQIALTKYNIERCIYFMPSQVLPQLIKTDIPWARTMISMTYPIHVLGGKDMARRQMLAKCGREGLYIMPYSCLSTKDAEENLHNIDAGAFWMDEAQNVARQGAARTKRVMRFIDEKKPVGAAYSGTITSKSIKDYYHLIRWIAGDNCPLPLTATLASSWASIIDASAGQADTGELDKLIHWAREHPGSYKDSEGTSHVQQYNFDQPGFRKAFQRRLTTSPCVVTTGDAEIGTSICFVNKPVRDYKLSEGWSRLEELGKQVEEAWLTPNGDEIEHAIHTWKWLYEIYGGGFYNELIWPTTAAYAARKQIGESEAQETLLKAVKHHAYGQVYAKLLRTWLQDQHTPGLDTPFLVGGDMSQHGAENVPIELYETWKDWKDADFDGRPDRDSRSIRVCPFKIDAAVEWVFDEVPYRSGEGCILWTHHQEVGRWLAESLKHADLPVLHCPAGPAHNSTIIDKAHKGKIVVASMTAHGTGKNLQHFHHQYFVQWPRPSVMAEQTLGRLHRNGQTADRLNVFTCHTLEFDNVTFAATLNDALYIHQTTGNRQKLIYGDYSPLPKWFPPRVLQERGLQAKNLDVDMTKMLETLFGKASK